MRPAKIISYSVFAALFGLLAATSVFAIGSGSGGSAPACTQSTWSCTDWSSCSTSGTQTRNCTESFHCATAGTPEPATSQFCTPPVSPPAPPPVAPQAAPTPFPSKPACASSKWQCDSWSPKCDIYGQEHRLCHLVADCVAHPTPSPATSEACSHLQCGDKKDMHDRIACRLNLAPEGATKELTIQYLPEECRVTTDRTEKAECIARYKSFSPCWKIPAGESRFSCAKNVLKLGPVISDEAKTCQGKNGAEQVACKKNLRENVLYMIKFRFYDLEQRAEDLARRGADLGAVANLETTIETKKQAFDAAKTDDELRQIILDVRAAWRDFVSKIKDQVE